MPPQDIVSSKNPLVKRIRKLARPGRREDAVLVEGAKLVDAALEAGFTLEALLLSSEMPEARRAHYRALAPTVVSGKILDALSSLESPEGVLAVVRRPQPPIGGLAAEGIVAVAVGIQEPGNLGALARVAEAAGAAALVTVPGTTDPYGAKAIRGSMGSLLRLPVFEIETLHALRERGFRLVALVPRGGTDYRDIDWRPPVAVLLGSESHGLDEESLALADIRATIPMRGRVESLNVATAAALVLYEAARP